MTHTLHELGELAIIKRLTAQLPTREDVAVGAGDDCAVVRVSGDEDWVLTSDPVIQNVHFSDDEIGVGVGRKAVGRVLSDIAAMGASPCWALVDLVAPRDTEVPVVDRVYAGILETAAAHGLVIVGGDVAEGPCLEAHLFGIGALPKGSAITRAGASPGDLLFVTGSLGGSRLGAHLEVAPRVKEGQWLRDWATAMIDVSDGLASDLRHLAAASGAGCRLNVSAIPISRAAQSLTDGLPALDHALHDGEDFELLLTVAEERESAFSAAWRDTFELPCTRIGVITDQKELLECVFPSGDTVALEGHGYSHFTPDAID